jgi:hypothetical protein
LSSCGCPSSMRGLEAWEMVFLDIPSGSRILCRVFWIVDVPCPRLLQACCSLFCPQQHHISKVLHTRFLNLYSPSVTKYTTYSVADAFFFGLFCGSLPYLTKKLVKWRNASLGWDRSAWWYAISVDKVQCSMYHIKKSFFSTFTAIFRLNKNLDLMAYNSKGVKELVQGFFCVEYDQEKSNVTNVQHRYSFRSSFKYIELHQCSTSYLFSFLWSWIQVHNIRCHVFWTLQLA